MRSNGDLGPLKSRSQSEGRGAISVDSAMGAGGGSRGDRLQLENSM